VLYEGKSGNPAAHPTFWPKNISNLSCQDDERINSFFSSPYPLAPKIVSISCFAASLTFWAQGLMGKAKIFPP
jgi:hypothetical protein